MEHQSICEEENVPVDVMNACEIETVTNNTMNETPAMDSTTKQQSHPSPTDTLPVPTLLRKVGSNLKSLPLGLPSRKTCYRKPLDIYIPPPRDVYFENLGLLQTPKVVAWSKSPRKSVTEEDCQIIDLTLDNPQLSVLPMTPRTKSLMSQLSRDEGSARKRQLSFSQTLTHSAVQRIKTESIESESSDDTEEDSKKVQKAPPRSAILGLPLTSPLGQRLKQHWNSEHKHYNVLSEYELFCNTNKDYMEEQDQPKSKNLIVEKLRHRQPPPVTFKFSKKYINKWFHSYKFNKADRHEFQKRIRTGLTRESRLLRKKLKPCKVVLTRISAKDIKYWTTPRPRLTQPKLPKVNQYQVYFSHANVSGQRPSLFSNRRYIPPVLSKPTFRPNILQMPYMRQSGPTPQLLVRSVPGNCMQLQVVPVHNHISACGNARPQLHSQLFTPSYPLAHTQKRKQVFAGLKQSDLVICVSSDEEDDDEKQKKLSCAMCRVSKDKCSVHGNNKVVNSRSKYTDGYPITPTTKFGKEGEISTVDSKTQQSTFAKLEVRNVHGGSFHLSTTGVTDYKGQASDYSHVRIANGKACVMDLPPISSHSAVMDTPTISSDTSKEENTLDTEDNVDYEVICIDSDEES